MKAKELAELLLQNPEMEVSYFDCEVGHTNINGVNFVKIVGNDYRTDNQLQNMRDAIASFKVADLESEYNELSSTCDTTATNPIELWGTLETFITIHTEAHIERIKRLEEFDKVRYSLGLYN